MDGIPLFGTREGVIDRVVEHFEQHFEVCVEDQITKFLRFEIDGDKDLLKMYNSPVIKSLLEHFNMTDYNAAKAPLRNGPDLSLMPKDVVSDTASYLQLTGSLLHLASTVRPKIALAVGYFSRFMHCPTTQLKRANKQILRCLKMTERLELVFSSNAVRAIKM